MKKLISYLLIGMVTLFMSACNSSYSGNVDAEYTSGVINLAAPDLVVVESDITVENEVESITKVTVTINITHDDYFSDMYISLISPEGTEVSLSEQEGPDEAAYINITFDDDAAESFDDQYDVHGTIDLVGTFYGYESLSDMNGEDANGVWTLVVNDNIEGDGTGELISWGLTIE